MIQIPQVSNKSKGILFLWYTRYVRNTFGLMKYLFYGSLPDKAFDLLFYKCPMIRGKLVIVNMKVPWERRKWELYTMFYPMQHCCIATNFGPLVFMIF